MTAASLERIADVKRTADVVPIYVDLIRQMPDSPALEVNKAIIEKWSRSALLRIKTKAWRIVETNRDASSRRLNINSIEGVK